MKFNIITNLDDGRFNSPSKGLHCDYLVLGSLLEQLGVEVCPINIFSRVGNNFADVNIFLETLHEGRYLHCAKENWFIPNSEWYYPEWDKFLSAISKVFCKTRDAERIWKAKVGDKAFYSGFESSDLYLPHIDKQPSFIHVAGKSLAKNTATLLNAWRNIRAPLTVVTSGHPGSGDEARGKQIGLGCRGISNVHLLHNLSNSDLAVRMNQCRFVIQPSMYEGFGHCLHEGFSCKAVVLTTNAPPMCEFTAVDSRMLLPVRTTQPMRLAKFHHVDPVGIIHTVEKAMTLPDSELDIIGERSRAAFLNERDSFRTIFKQVVSELL